MTEWQPFWICYYIKKQVFGLPAVY